MNRHVTTEFRALMHLAIPLALAQAGTQLMGVVDTAVVGRLGTNELAAVGLGNTLFFAVSIIGIGIVMSIDPLTAQAFGAGEALRARRYMWQGVWLATGVGLVLSVPMAIVPFLADRIGISPAVVIETRAYLLIRTLSVVPTLVFMVVRSYLQAAGHTRPMVIAMLVGNVFNLLADLLFVFGGSSLPAWTGPLRNFPAFGVAGAAIATVLGSVLQLAIIVEGVRIVPEASFTREMRRPVRSEILHAFRVGLPIGLQWCAEVGIFALVALLAGRFGPDQLAAHQIAITLASFTFTVAVGIGAAGSVRVGRAVGARDQAGTRLSGLVALGAGAGFMAMCGLAFLVIPRILSSMLTNQAEVIAVAIPLLGVAAIFQISDGVQAVGAGVLRGAGDTKFPFTANLLGHWLVGFPVAWFLGFYLGSGIVGLWWGLCAGLAVVAILLFLRFLRKSSTAIAPLVG